MQVQGPQWCQFPTIFNYPGYLQPQHRHAAGLIMKWAHREFPVLFLSLPVGLRLFSSVPRNFRSRPIGSSRHQRFGISCHTSAIFGCSHHRHFGSSRNNHCHSSEIFGTASAPKVATQPRDMHFGCFHATSVGTMGSPHMRTLQGVHSWLSLPARGPGTP